MNMTSVPFGPRRSASRWRLPSVPSRSKSGAFVPSAVGVLSIAIDHRSLRHSRPRGSLVWSNIVAPRTRSSDAVVTLQQRHISLSNIQRATSDEWHRGLTQPLRPRNSDEHGESVWTNRITCARKRRNVDAWLKQLQTRRPCERWKKWRTNSNNVLRRSMPTRATDGSAERSRAVRDDPLTGATARPSPE